MMYFYELILTINNLVFWGSYMSVSIKNCIHKNRVLFNNFGNFKLVSFRQKKRQPSIHCSSKIIYFLNLRKHLNVFIEFYVEKSTFPAVIFCRLSEKIFLFFIIKFVFLPFFVQNNVFPILVHIWLEQSFILHKMNRLTIPCVTWLRRNYL